MLRADASGRPACAGHGRWAMSLSLVLSLALGQAMLPRPPPPPPMTHGTGPVVAPSGPNAVPLPGKLPPPALPKSPNKRVLPPEARPGVWASDGEAKKDDVASRLEVPEPTPEGTTGKAWRACWNSVQSCLLSDPRAVRASLAEFQCLRWDFAGVCGGLLTDKGTYRYPGFVAKYGAGPYDLDKFNEAVRPAKYAPCAEAWKKPGFDDLRTWLFSRCSADWYKLAQH